MVGGPNAAGFVKDDAVSVVAEDIVACEICGSGSRSQFIAKCARCNTYEHRYCMKVVMFMIPREWYCAKCQEYVNGDPKPFVRSRLAMRQPNNASSPLTTKHLSNLNCVSIRSDTQVQALKRCARHGDTGCKPEMGCLNENKGVIFTMDSIEEYSRRPAPAICWRGCFHVSYAGARLNLGEFKAQFPSKVSSRVVDTIKLIPSDLQLELLPRMDDWPKSFETTPPVHEDIGLFFFFDKPVGCQKKHSNLLEDYDNYVLRAYIDGIKLLIYSSEVLLPDSQWIDGENYLWGIFVRSKGKSDPWQFGSTTTR